jgi:hypothetical protein
MSRALQCLGQNASGGFEQHTIRIADLMMTEYNPERSVLPRRLPSASQVVRAKLNVSSKFRALIPDFASGTGKSYEMGLLGKSQPPLLYGRRTFKIVLLPLG